MDVIKFSKDDILKLYIKQVNNAIETKSILNGFINDSLNYNNFGFSFSVFKNLNVKSVVTFYKTNDKHYLRLLFNNGNFNKESNKNEIYQDIDENLSVKNNHLRYTYEVDYDTYKDNLNLFNTALKESLLSKTESIVENDSDEITFNMNDEIIIYPNDDGLNFIKIAMGCDISDQLTSDGGFKDKAWCIFHNLCDMFFNGTIYFKYTNIKVLKDK